MTDTQKIEWLGAAAVATFGGCDCTISHPDWAGSLQMSQEMSQAWDRCSMHLAAADMLAALEAVKRSVNEGNYHDAWSYADAAIAQAKGEA
jgi:hypothetical protein